MPTFQLRQPTWADLPTVRAIADAAYATTYMPNPDGIELPLYLDTPEGKAAEDEDWQGLWSRLLVADPEEYIFQVMVEVDDDGNETKVVGWTSWIPAGLGVDDEIKAELHPGINRAGYERGKRGKADAKKRLFPDEYKSMWELDDIVVHPDYYGKGLGSRILKHGLTIAASQGRDVVLFARTPAVPFYLKHGVVKPEGSRLHLRSVHDVMVWRHNQATV